ncbi:MAG: hypothetical protein JOZ69_03260 [Myxococcales bacterium]|nr:hypothetical protein [Myxococcales bacterium]
MPRSLLVLVLVLACSSALAACSSAARREGRALLAAVDRYRHAEGSSRPALGEAVSGVPCTDREVCDAKRACLAAIEPTTRAGQLKDAVAARLSEIEGKRLAPSSPEAQALPSQLDEADRLLQEGRARMVDCERRLADLQIRYGL